MGKKKKENRFCHNTAKGHGVQIQNTKGKVKVKQSHGNNNKELEQNAAIINNNFYGSSGSATAKAQSGDSPLARFKFSSPQPLTVILFVLVIIFAFSATMLFIYTKNIQRIDDSDPIEIGDTQRFSSVSQSTERAGILYTEYVLTSEPANSGFHVRPYPYIVYTENGGDTVLPILNLFSQEEYIANTSGQCTLLQESLPSSFADPNNSKRIFTLGDVHCFVAILYTEDTETIRVLYELRDGELIEANKEIAVQVLQLFEDIDNFATLDIRSLPLSYSE